MSATLKAIQSELKRLSRVQHVDFMKVIIPGKQKIYGGEDPFDE